MAKGYTDSFARYRVAFQVQVGILEKRKGYRRVVECYKYMLPILFEFKFQGPSCDSYYLLGVGSSSAGFCITVIKLPVLQVACLADLGILTNKARESPEALVITTCQKNFVNSIGRPLEPEA